MVKSKKKKQCTSGYSCGASCISVTKECRVEFPTGVSVGLDRRAVQRNPDNKEVKGEIELKTKRKKEDFEMVEADASELLGKRVILDEVVRFEGERINYVLRDPEDALDGELDATIELNEGKMDAQAKNLLENRWNGKSYEVIWGTKNEDAKQGSPEEKLRAALEAKKMWEKDILPTLEDGTLLVNSPDGGPGSIRDRLYRRGGFGRIQHSYADDLAFQYAMVVNGKLVPLELGEPSPEYQALDIPESKLESWDFAEYSKEDVVKIAKEMDVTLTGEDWSIYLDLLNEK